MIYIALGNQFVRKRENSIRASFRATKMCGLWERKMKKEVVLYADIRITSCNIYINIESDENALNYIQSKAKCVLPKSKPGLN